jgi:hypothetical protein
MTAGNYAGGLERLRTASQDYAGTPAETKADADVAAALKGATGELNPQKGCDALAVIDAFVAATIDTQQAIAARPAALYDCGQHLFQTKEYGSAVLQYDELLKKYPNSAFAARARAADVDAKVQELRSGAGNLSPPQRSGSAVAGTVVLIFENDAPDAQEFLFSGPQSKAVLMGKCGACQRYSGQGPAFCPSVNGPTVTVTLTPGRYQVVLHTPAEATIRVGYGAWTLTTGSTYRACWLITGVG